MASTGSASNASGTTKSSANGLRVIRFWNNDVLGNLDGVLIEILRVLRER